MNVNNAGPKERLQMAQQPAKRHSETTTEADNSYCLRCLPRLGQAGNNAVTIQLLSTTQQGSRAYPPNPAT